MKASVRNLSSKTSYSSLQFVSLERAFISLKIISFLLPFNSRCMPTVFSGALKGSVKTYLVNIFWGNKGFKKIYLWNNEISVQLITGFEMLRHAGTAQAATSRSLLPSLFLSLFPFFFPFFLPLLPLPSLSFPLSFLSSFFLSSFLPSFLQLPSSPIPTSFHLSLPSCIFVLPSIFGTHRKAHVSGCFLNMGRFSFHGRRMFSKSIKQLSGKLLFSCSSLSQSPTVFIEYL